MDDDQHSQKKRGRPKTEIEGGAEAPTSLRLTRELLARADRLVGKFGESRADVLRAAISQGLVGLEEQSAIGKAAIAKVALETLTHVLGQDGFDAHDQQALASARALGEALQGRDVVACVRLWNGAAATIRKYAETSTDEALLLYEGEVVRRTVGEVPVVAGRPGWAMQAVRELVGEERYRTLFR